MTAGMRAVTADGWVRAAVMRKFGTDYQGFQGDMDTGA